MSSFSENIPVKNWVMQNTSFSHRNTIRGLHYQSPHAQSKLITVINGSITDVILNIDLHSEFFGQYQLYHLSSTDESLPNQLYVPRHYAHGFAVTSESALVSYLTDDHYQPDFEKSIHPLSDELQIPWGIENPLLSEKDASAPHWQPDHDPR